METNYKPLTPSPSWRKGYDFQYVLYSNILFSCISFAIVSPSIWPYIDKHNGTDWFLALVLFMASLGEMSGALIFGYLHNYMTTKLTYLLCITTGFIGAFIYVIADYLEDYAALWMIFSARVFLGAWSGGQQAVEAAYSSEVVKDIHKAKMFAEIGIFTVIGFISGPLIGIGLMYIDLDLGPIHFNQYTWPGTVLCGLTIAGIALVSFKFKEVPHIQRLGSAASFSGLQTEPPNKRGVFACYVIFFICASTYSVHEAVAIPLVTDTRHIYTDNFEWNQQEAYALFAGASATSIFAFLVMHTTSGKVDNRKFLLITMSIHFLSYFLLLDYDERKINHGMFLVGYFISSACYNLGKNVIIAMISNINGPYQAGGLLGWLLAIGGSARMIGPFWAVETIRVSPKLCYGMTGGLIASAISVLLGNWENCKLHAYYRKY